MLKIRGDESERSVFISISWGLPGVQGRRHLAKWVEPAAVKSCDTLFRWFLDMNLMERSFDPTVFTKNRRRLLEHRIGQALFDQVVVEADRQKLLSDEHFSVDGTLIEAAASIKSFRRRDEEQQQPDDDPGNPSVDFRGERRSNETHQSSTDPEARLMRKGKGKEAKLVFFPVLDGE